MNNPKTMPYKLLSELIRLKGDHTDDQWNLAISILNKIESDSFEPKNSTKANNSIDKTIRPESELQVQRESRSEKESVLSIEEKLASYDSLGNNASLIAFGRKFLGVDYKKSKFSRSTMISKFAALISNLNQVEVDDIFATLDLMELRVKNNDEPTFFDEWSDVIKRG